jgi:hypothetical protein
MRSSKKSAKMLSALSVAAVTALASHAASGVTLSMFYGNDPNYSNSNNAVIVGSGLTPSYSAANFDLTGAAEYFAAHTNVSVSQTKPTTITVPVGDYLSLAVDAVVTGNVNPDGGKSTGPGTKSDVVQPNYLGLSDLGVEFNSSDTYGQLLTPVTFSASPISGAANGGTTYFSTASVNTQLSAFTGQTRQGPNGGSGSNAYNVIPNWAGLVTAGDVEPNSAGNNASTGASADSGPHASGAVGINSFPFGGAESPTTSVQAIEQFASTSSTASYNDATDFLDSLIYEGLSPGLVTLAPVVQTGATDYWVLTTAGSSTTASQYRIHSYGPNNTAGFGPSDTIKNLPVLVIDVVGTTQVHPVVNLADSAADNPNYPNVITQGNGNYQGTFSPPNASTLMINGQNAAYSAAQVTGINSNAGEFEGNVQIARWSPITDPEIYGVDVMVNGTQATAAQIQTLLTAINGADGKVPDSLGVLASATDPTNGVLSGLDTSSTTYNLFLTFSSGGPSAADDLGIDLSQTNDPYLAGYSFTAVAVVPEPMTLSLLTLGGIGVMSRRNRRKSEGFGLHI